MGEEITLDDIAELEYTDNPSEMVQGSNESVDSGQMTTQEKLMAVQLKIGKIVKDQVNPHFKNNYADINQVIEVLKEAANEVGLLVNQPIIVENGKHILLTELDGNIHSEMLLPDVQNPQHLGSAITYYRRYALQSLFLMQAEDDDGNIPQQQPKNNYPTVQIADEYPTQAIRR